MLKHPSIVVPDVGDVDHAWDLLGLWNVAVQRDPMQAPVHGTVTWTSWDAGVLQLPVGLAAPSEILTRASLVQRVPAGGGALTFLVEGPTLGALIATLWPGELQLIGPVTGTEQLVLRARRAPDYYRAKYPLEPV